ncbi:ATP-binding cassette domain-containing protein [uncultured Desulfovibrio sp.]|uniref:ATP-binding cassette domain-containing protein n=1 Tax=Candidatus Desulfovibrio intestinavium TaxID=2838534 RepID=A0A9D2KPJ4_9BACT|nr:ATP-binding cassette domain-containing protein [uncultured Desulfovibrio sp.]HJA78837.1 ATP-binding cassette domain-containing protein [Candidatus Desulfovibrio intestinavium]
MNELVRVEDVSLSLPGQTPPPWALRHIDWRIERGEHCALMGDNGAGKSTLLRLLNGQCWPAEGRVVWNGPDGPEDAPLAGRAISALVSPALQENYQRQAWYISGRELVLTGFDDTPLLYTSSADERRQEAEALARRLDALPLLEALVPEMSQGQLRLLLLARALVRRPALLLLDECADGLDDQHRRLFFAELDRARQHSTIIMSTHRPEQLPDWCRLVRRVTAGRLLPPEPLERAGWMAAAALSPAPAPSPVPVTPPSPPDPDGEPLLDVQNATVFIDRKEILHAVNWQLRRGEHWRIVGANGSGKSTFLRMLAGDEFVADGGSIRRSLPGQGGQTVMLRDIRKGVRLVSDLSQALYGYSLDALELVCSGWDNTVGNYRDYSEEEVAQARAVMARLDCVTLAGKSIRRLSTGQLRRLFLARALLGGPDILLLDEPCSGLDEGSRRQYLALLDKLAGEGLHLVFVSHLPTDGPSCLNRTARMEGGRLHVVDGSAPAQTPLAAV